ncbi:hypothetical protein [Nocardioides houyundeii]|uniref:hypothetical protein n=1 Tax=Nocardioides houyundeii TaxID=2045452 RepID=UPI0013B39D73|nr:hypothetical protein [Nocardioides houyundeii]
MLVIGVVLVVMALALAVAGLAGLGDRRRGHGFSCVVLAGIFFPMTWTVRYVMDERPYQRCRRATAGRSRREGRAKGFCRVVYSALAS